MELEENILANSPALSKDDDKTSGSLMMAGIGDLPRPRTLLVIHQNSRDPSLSWSILACTDKA